MNDDDLTFTFDGATVHARRGWTIGAALLASGVTSWRTTRSRGRPRGLFCGIGACFDCLVDVNGDRAVRACLVPVQDGDRVRTSASVGAGEPGPRNTPASRAAGEGAAGSCESADVAVVGAGPAGMAAALAAADLGCQVTLIDSAAAMGGQIYRQRLITGDGTTGMPGGSGQIPRRLHRAARHQRIQYLPATTVWHAETHDASGESQHGQFLLWLADATGRAPGRADAPGVLRARAVVVATGATELVLPFPGWDLPGVTTAGAAQALLKSHGLTAGRRVLVAGSGPLLLPVAAGLADAGARVVAVLEAAPARAAACRATGLARYPGKLREAAGYLAVLARHRVPVRTGHAVLACNGTDRVRSATVAKLDGTWRPVPGTARDVTVDAIHVSFGFSPALELTRMLGCADVPHPARPTASVWHDADYATSVPGVFAAGETTGVGGAEAAELEGYLAGAGAARHLGRVSAAVHASRTRRVRTRLAGARRFAALLDDLYPFMHGWLDWPAPDTPACRCEDAPWKAIGEAAAAGARDMRAAKGLTRCGMGYCQGRVCGPALQYALASATGRRLADTGDLHSRPLLAPTSLGAIAASQGDRPASPWPE